MSVKKAIPIQTLQLEVMANKQSPQVNKDQVQKAVIGSGGFKIPQTVIEEKKKMFSTSQKKDEPILDMQVSQLEIYQKMGLQPYKMQNAMEDKEKIVFQNLKDQPLAKSNFIFEQRRVVEIEQKDIENRMNQFVIEEEAPPQNERLDQIQSEIDKHYDRLDKLEQQFMKQDLVDSYQPDDNVWEKIKQLREYRNNIKKEQMQAKEEYEERRRKDQVQVKVTVVDKQQQQVLKKQNKKEEKDQFIQQQIDDYIKQKEQNKNRPRSKEKYIEQVVMKSPEQQLYEHQFLEYQKDKNLKKQMEIKAKEFQVPEFEKYHLKEDKEKPKHQVNITDRAILKVQSIDELHRVQVQAYTDKQLDQLDDASKKAIYKSIVTEKQQEKQIENEKNEQFVLKFSFQQIDKDHAGVVSKGEVLEFLCTNKDIQIIFDLDVKTIESELDKLQTHRKGLLDFSEFSKFVKRLQQDRIKLLSKLKQDSKLFEENQEENLRLQYSKPIKEIFKILDYQEQGVVNRLDLIRAIRNDLSKGKGSILNQPISLQQGSPTVNQVLEKVLADYRLSKNRKQMELISLNQLEEYFKLSLPYEEIRLMQARIILAHFGPGSIASEGYYEKMKGRCLLEHEVIQQMLEIFMKLDKDCELIVSKKELIQQIRETVDCNQEAAILTKIGKKYTLASILDMMESTLNQLEGHASNFISLQQFTEYLTNFNPLPPKIPKLFFVNEQKDPPTEEHLVMQIPSVYFQIINDVFEMIPTICAHFILKEEFIATVKNDPQSKSLLSQIAKIDPISKRPETINSIISKIARTEIDFIQWADIVYIFSDKGEIPREDLENKLDVKPVPRRGRKIYESVIKGQIQEEEDAFAEIENLSFDDAQQKRIDKKAQSKMHSSSLNKITVPKEPKFHERKKKTIRQQRLEQMVKEIEEKEEFELQNKFKANPIPLSMFVPAHNLDRFSPPRVQNANPPSFYQKDVQKFMERKQIAEERLQTKEAPKTFKAKEIPVECTMEVLKQKEIAENQRKKEQREKRKAELQSTNLMPKRLQEDEQKRKEKKKKMEELNPQDIDPECKFNPKINKNFVSKRDKDKKSQQSKGMELNYLDEDNQRNKRKESFHEEEQQNQTQKSQTQKSQTQRSQSQKQSVQKSQQSQKQVSQQISHNQLEESQQEKSVKVSQKQQSQKQQNSNQDDGEMSPEPEDDYQDQQFEDQAQEKQNEDENKEDDQYQNQENQDQDEQEVQEQEQVEQQENKTMEQKTEQEMSIQQSKKSQQLSKQSEIKQEDVKPQKNVKIVPPAPQPAQQNDEKKEKKKVVSSQDRELQRLQEEKQKKLDDKKKQKDKLNPEYRQKIQDMENRVFSRPLVRDAKQHGSSTLQKYRQMAKEASLKKDEKNEEKIPEDQEPQNDEN
ncbi:unnamed protein product [Paramecium octaurelia]|uniref:EF-hand domain-containing protein n=1 Tax=Paramecium octaurelia TaxID=43137 RepID=A0A8S1TIC5_PAROT|nr:unnamed protein product [Paramecium octaurelia]